jgi:hypothetical protein
MTLAISITCIIPSFDCNQSHPNLILSKNNDDMSSLVILKIDYADRNVGNRTKSIQNVESFNSSINF